MTLNNSINSLCNDLREEILGGGGGSIQLSYGGGNNENEL